MRIVVCLLLCLGLLTHNLLAEELRQQPKKMVASKNFVVTAVTDQLAWDILQRADQLREQIALEWLGEPMPDGIGRAVVSAKISDIENSGRTWSAEDPRRPTMVWLRSSVEELTGGLLAHEITHVVLQNQFPGQMPPWANEGIAGLADSPARKKIKFDILQSYLITGRWPNVDSILSLKQISSSDQGSYATASSLIEYFLTQGSRETLLDFVIDGAQSDWNQALQTHYDIDDTSTLQTDWQRWLSRSLSETTNEEATTVFSRTRRPTIAQRAAR